jgi:hypothetical protein
VVLTRRRLRRSGEAGAQATPPVVGNVVRGSQSVALVGLARCVPLPLLVEPPQTQRPGSTAPVLRVRTNV